MKINKNERMHEAGILAFCRYLPKNWVIEKMVKGIYRYSSPKDNYNNIDFQIIICDKGWNFTNEEFKVSIYSSNTNNNTIKFPMKYLKWYQNNHVPIALVKWAKSTNKFYYTFAQEYIDKNFSELDFNESGSKSIKLSELKNINQLEELAQRGFDYIANRHVESLKK